MKKVNYKIIFYFIGVLLMFNGGFMFLASLLSYFYDDGITKSLILSGLLVFSLGTICFWFNKSFDKQLNKKEGKVCLRSSVLTLKGNPLFFRSTAHSFCQHSQAQKALRENQN